MPTDRRPNTYPYVEIRAVRRRRVRGTQAYRLNYEYTDRILYCTPEEGPETLRHLYQGRYHEALAYLHEAGLPTRYVGAIARRGDYRWSTYHRLQWYYEGTAESNYSCAECSRRVCGSGQYISGFGVLCSRCNTVCPNCGGRVRGWRRLVTSAELSDGSYIDGCTGCLITCYGCGDSYPEMDLSWDNNDHAICPLCESHHYSCDDCGNWVQDSDVTEQDGYYYCEHCYRQNPANTTGLTSDGQHYTDVYNPRYECRGEEKAIPNLYMGVELEVEVIKGEVDDAAQDFHDTFSPDWANHFFIKDDGSLHHGFELVTHPLTLGYHKNTYAWREMVRHLVRLSCRSHQTTTCGLHVHVSKRAFSELDEIKLGFLVHTQQVLMEKIARRGANDYARFVMKGKCPKKGDNRNQNNGRYEAVNFQNRNTIEFRLFKGTLKYTTLMATLEFVHCLILFVQNYSVARLLNRPETTEALIEWIRDHKKEYPHLVEYCKERGVIETKAEVMPANGDREGEPVCAS